MTTELEKLRAHLTSELQAGFSDAARLALVVAALLRSAGMEPTELRATALTLRDLADAEAIAPGEPMTHAQQIGIDALRERLPASGVVLMETARPHLQRRADLYALVGVLLSAWEKWNHLDRVGWSSAGARVTVKNDG